MTWHPITYLIPEPVCTQKSAGKHPVRTFCELRYLNSLEKIVYISYFSSLKWLSHSQCPHVTEIWVIFHSLLFCASFKTKTNTFSELWFKEEQADKAFCFETSQCGCCCYTVSKADPWMHRAQGLMGVLLGTISEWISNVAHGEQEQFMGECRKNSQHSNNTCHPCA